MALCPDDKESAMRILRLRRGFQADHSSSSYLFYAVDHPVSAAGKKVAHRFSSRAEVDERSVRYQKWGESELSWEADKALLGEHYDVMASESYDWWTLMMAVPRTAATQALLAPFVDARGSDDLGVEVEDYGRRLAVAVHCMFDYSRPIFEYDEDTLDTLVDLLAVIRGEILKGDVSFLQAVASFYGADEDEEDEDGEEDTQPARSARSLEGLSKAELQQECADRGIPFRKAWTKDQLRAALAAADRRTASPSPPARGTSGGRPPRLSKAARQIVDSLTEP
jgi:hypothetical protein